MTRLLGRGLHEYVAYYINETYAHVSIGGAKVQPPYDMVVEIWLDDETWQNLGTFLKTPEGRKIPEDETHWLDQESPVTLVVEENVII